MAGGSKLGAVGASCTVELRVRYPECDPMGFVHHARYFEYMEIARTDLLRQNGYRYADMEREGVYFVVVKLECRFLRPLRYDDLLQVTARVDRITRTRVDHSYTLTSAGIVTTEATSTLACIGRDGRPMLMPDAFWEEG